MAAERSFLQLPQQFAYPIHLVPRTALVRHEKAFTSQINTRSNVARIAIRLCSADFQECVPTRSYCIGFVQGLFRKVQVGDSVEWPAQITIDFPTDLIHFKWDKLFLHDVYSLARKCQTIGCY